MKTFKKALLGLALATCAAVNANATAITGTDFVFADLSGDGLQATYSFIEGGAGVKAGDTFTYDIFFNTPPSDPTTSFAYMIKSAVNGTVVFDSQVFTDYFGDMFNLTMINAGNAVAGAGWIDSGTYDIQVTGRFLADGASFVGAALDDVTDVSGTIPEPMSLALVGLGLAGLAGSRRRRTAAPVAA